MRNLSDFLSLLLSVNKCEENRYIKMEFNKKLKHTELPRQWSRYLRNMYYRVKPALPRSFQIFLRRKRAERIRRRSQAYWPISPLSAEKPVGWKGWKDNKQFVLILTHDVDTQKGYNRHQQLLALEKEMGFVSSFNFVPEKYSINKEDLVNIQKQGYEVGVHGLKHDGKLFQSEETFRGRARKINGYIRDWGGVGFRAPAMHHNLEWIKLLHIKYDASTFDTDPFEPQAEGVDTIFPFPVFNGCREQHYWELPYTLPQDFTVFIILQETSIDIWCEKMAWIAEKGGMVLLNTHPDYMNFDSGVAGSEEYPIDFYKNFLLHIKEKYGNAFWNPLPKQLVEFLGGIY